ncbi:MAG: response regulator transcription factor [Clostridiaceae bacterium]|nr:response regulator transcription factor [Clostridiaceae bacterium]
MKKILIVEDDMTIAGALAEHFTAWGMETRYIRDFTKVIEEFASFSPHITLMDISLPYRGGFYFCGEIRKFSKSPIIFISSASDNMNILTAINMGGDDFVAKPFDLAILTAKIQALLRRTYDFTSSSDFLEHNGVILNIDDATAHVNGQKLELTKNEYRILYVLISSKGKVVSREALMERLWASDSFVDENTLSVNVTRLRRKLESAGEPDFIVTKKGMGYIVE